MAPKVPLSIGCALHNLCLFKVLLNTSDENSKIPSITTAVTILYMVTDGTIYIVLRTDVLTTLPIITLDSCEEIQKNLSSIKK